MQSMCALGLPYWWQCLIMHLASALMLHGSGVVYGMMPPLVASRFVCMFFWVIGCIGMVCAKIDGCKRQM